MEEKIKKYYLGELSEPEAELLEREVAEDENLFEQAEIIEDEIVDDYVRGDLSLAEKLLFESNYLTTKARYEKVQFARLFLNQIEKYAQEPVVEKEQKSFRQTVFAGFKLYKAFALATLAFLAISVGFAVWLNLQNKPEIAERQESNQLPTLTVENTNNQTVQNTNTINQNVNVGSNKINQNSQNHNNKKIITPAPEIKPSPTPKPAEPIRVTLASFILLPGSLRSNGEQLVKILPNINKAALRLTLPKEAVKYPSYNATIKTSDGETVFTASNLKSLNLILSADKLKNKTYIIFLEGNSPEKPAESVSEYTFRVQR
jgi:hypothetical protein